MMGVKMTGQQELERWFKKFPSDFNVVMNKGVRLTANDIRNEWMQFITDMDAIDTGRYRNSISIRLPDMLSAEIYTVVEYAVNVEFGTRNVYARPAMMAAATKIGGNLLKRFLEVMRKKYK